MPAAAKAEMPEATDIVTIVEANPVMVLTDREKFNQFYEAIKRETDELEADVSTEKGRAAIKSMAFKVAQTKTTIDKAGKQLNEEARLKINAVDAARREIWDQLETLQKQVRAPVTEWEEAEENRVSECKTIIDKMKSFAAVAPSDTSADIAEMIAEIEGITISEGRFKELAPIAETVRSQTIQALNAELERAKVAEAERAELEKLRTEAAEREAREAAEREQREQAERERIAAEEAEVLRKASEEAEAARIKQAEERAAQAAREEAETKASEEASAREAELQAQVDEERRQREESERAAQADRDRVVAEQAARIAEQDQAAAALAKREADQKHRGTIMRAAKEAIMEAGSVDEATAKNIVLAIAAKGVPHVTIAF